MREAGNVGASGSKLRILFSHPFLHEPLNPKPKALKPKLKDPKP